MDFIFEKVGTLKIKGGFKRTGSFGVLNNFKEWVELLTDPDKELMVFGKKIPVRLICEMNG